MAVSVEIPDAGDALAGLVARQRAPGLERGRVEVGGVAVAAKVTQTSSGYMYEIDGAGMNPAGAKIEFFDGVDLIFECDIV